MGRTESKSNIEEFYPIHVWNDDDEVFSNHLENWSVDKVIHDKHNMPQED